MSTNEPILKRTIGVWGLASAVINVTVGAGIFVLPALVAERMGSAAILCFIICAVLIFSIGLCFAEVGSKITGSGGAYAYIESAFGLYAGFLANNIFWIGSSVVSDAAIANGLLKTLSFFFPLLELQSLRILFFLILFGGLAVLNIRGTKRGLGLVIFLTIAKLIPLILIIMFASGKIIPANLQWNTSFTINDIGATTLILFFAFTGIESAVSNSGEVKNPARVVPLGIITGLAIVLLLYISIQTVTQGILGDELLSFKDSPLSEISKRLFGYAGVVLITAGIAISMLGGLSGEILSIPRILYAGARDHIFPKIFSKVHPKYFTPYAAIIFYCSIGFSLAVLGTLKQLVVLSVAATLLIYLGVVLATIKMRYKKAGNSVKSFNIPGGIFVPVFAALSIIWLLSSLERQELIGISIALVVLSIIFWVMKHLKNYKINKENT